MRTPLRLAVVAALAMLSPSLATLAQSQDAPTVPSTSADLVLERVFPVEPIVGQPVLLQAQVLNDGSETASATVTFGWISPPRPIQGSGQAGVAPEDPPPGRGTVAVPWI